MTYEEAIKILTELKPIPIDGFKIIAEAYDLAIDALEKQIPKKPRETRCALMCARCGQKITENGCKKLNRNYCKKCGQAIDWEVSE